MAPQMQVVGIMVGLGILLYLFASIRTLDREVGVLTVALEESQGSQSHVVRQGKQLQEALEALDLVVKEVTRQRDDLAKVHETQGHQGQHPPSAVNTGIKPHSPAVSTGSKLSGKEVWSHPKLVFPPKLGP